MSLKAPLTSNPRIVTVTGPFVAGPDTGLADSNATPAPVLKTKPPGKDDEVVNDVQEAQFTIGLEYEAVPTIANRAELLHDMVGAGRAVKGHVRSVNPFASVKRNVVL